MKKPKLNLVEVFIVEDWGTEIKKGYGVFFEKITEGFCDYSEYWLCFTENENPKKVYKSHVFTDFAEASKHLAREKAEFIKYLKEDIAKNQKRLQEIN